MKYGSKNVENRTIVGNDIDTSWRLTFQAQPVHYCHTLLVDNVRTIAHEQLITQTYKKQRNFSHKHNTSLVLSLISHVVTVFF